MEGKGATCVEGKGATCTVHVWRQMDVHSCKGAWIRALYMYRCMWER